MLREDGLFESIGGHWDVFVFETTEDGSEN